MAVGKAMSMGQQGYWAQVNRLDQLASGTPRVTLDDKPPATAKAPPTSSVPKGKRRIYMLHSGMNDPQCTASQNLKAGLINRGVPAGDIISLPSPYPSFSDGLAAAARNVSLFRESSQPDSPVAKAALESLTRNLVERGVNPQDDLVWLGHSAGGQMGLTLAHSLEKTTPYRMNTVVTLGSPVCTNLAPRHVKVRQYISPGDGVLVATNQAPIADGITAEAFSGNLDSNDKLRIYPNVAHGAWVSDNKVLDRIIAEAAPAPEQPKATSAGSWLGNMLHQMWQVVNGFLDRNLGFSIETR